MDSSNKYNLIYEFINSYDDMVSTLTEYKMTLKSNNEYYLIKYNSNEVLEYNPEQNKYFNEFLRFFRGMIYNKNTNKIVCYGLDGKLNIEDFKKVNDYNNIYIEESIDGTLINLFYDNDEWNVSTKGSINAKKSFWYSNQSFYNLFIEAWNKYYKDFDELNKDYCYSFVLMHPNNQIVTYYKNPELRLLQIRDMNNFNLIGNHLKIDTPQKLDLISNNYNELNKLVNNLSYELEGFMLYSSNKLDRVKLKNKNYSNVKELKGNYRKILFRLVELNNNDTEKLNELLIYFPFYKHNLDRFLFFKKRFIGSLFYLYNKTKKQYKYIDYPNHISKYIYLLHNKYINNIKDKNIKKSINKKDCIDLFESLKVNEQINIIINHKNYIKKTEYNNLNEQRDY